MTATGGLDGLVEALRARPELVDMMAESKRIDAAALAYVNHAESVGMRPAMTYRCERTCLLAEVWQTPHGLIIAYPTVRLSGQRSVQVKVWHLGIPETYRTASGHAMKPRAHRLEDHAVLMACDHRWTPSVDPDMIRADVAQARGKRTGHTIYVQ